MESILLILSCTIILYSIYTLLKKYRNLAITDRNAKITSAERARRFNLSVRLFGAIQLAIILFFVVPWKNELWIIPLILSLLFLIAGSYILVFTPSFKYSEVERKSINNYASITEKNRLFLIIVGIALTTAGIIILALIYFKIK